jgi:hypothetical protein
VRILIRPRLPLLALLLLAPSIPELLTGSTPITNLVVNPLGFLVSYGFDIGLYGTGALLIREFSILLRRGWASVLVWGAAYGIAEEGLAVHTFFERSGPPVGALSVYGSAWGVNWLWALGLTVFHATYSIALPILLTYLWFPSARRERWVDRGALGLTGGVYLFVVVFFALLVGHGPTPAALLLFLAIEAGLLYVGVRLPSELLRANPGPSRVGRGWIGFAGGLEWIAWVATLILAGSHRVSAWAAAAVIIMLDGGAVLAVRRWVGSIELERAEFAFAAGMLVPLFLWDVVIEFTVPGILGVAAVFAYLLFRLGQTIEKRRTPGAIVPRAGTG